MFPWNLDLIAATGVESTDPKFEQSKSKIDESPRHKNWRLSLFSGAANLVASFGISKESQSRDEVWSVRAGGNPVGSRGPFVQGSIW
jgi:hypothetical protein